MTHHELSDKPLQKWQEAIWLFIALLIPLFVNFWVEQQFEASKIWLLRALVGLLAILWLASWLRGSQLNSLSPPIRNLIAALLLVLTLSTVLSDNRSIAFFGTLDRANGLLTQLSLILLFWCVATRITAEYSRLLLNVIALTAVPICLLGLAQAAGWQPLPVLTDARSLITTTLGRANFTGAYLALLLPLTLAAAQSSTENRWQRIGYLALFGLELIIILLTRARAAWIAAVVSVALFLWLQYAPLWPKQFRRVSVLGGIAALAGGLLLILQYGIATGGSIAARWTIWQASLRLLWPRLWLGYGADTLELHFPSVYPPELVYYQGRGVIVDRAHNWLLDWSLNYGIVATLIFIALVAFILWQGWKRLMSTTNVRELESGPKPLENRWLTACLAALCAQLVGNLFLFEVVSTAVVFWLLLAIVTAETAKSDTYEKGRERPSWMVQGGIIVSVAVVGWLVWLGSVRPLLADVYSWRGTNALTEGNVSEALSAYGTAARYQPQQAAYHVSEALVAAELNNFERAEAAIEIAIARHPTDPVLYTHLAAIYGREADNSPEKINLAYEAYEQAILLAPTIGLTYQQYADLALRSGDSENALIQARKAVDLDATDGVAFGILGWAQLLAGNLAVAENAFEQAVKWQPDSADFHFGLATIYFQRGDFNAAAQAVEQSLNRNPTYAPALALQLQIQE